MKSPSMINAQSVKLAVERASSWFSVHADHRMKMMNFYLILLGAILAGYATALEKNLPWFGLILSVLLLIVTYCFKQLDRRTAQLLKIGEAALLKIENSIFEATKISEIRLVLASENKVGVPSYRQTFNVLFSTGVALAILGIAFSIYDLLGYTS